MGVREVPWPVVDNFRRAFLFGRSPPSIFCVGRSHRGAQSQPARFSKADYGPVWSMSSPGRGCGSESGDCAERKEDRGKNSVAHRPSNE
jgi:hypothetical protein